jgi:hypothetical protein
LEENMPFTFEKLNLKNQRQIVLLSAPGSFEYELTALRALKIMRDLKAVDAIEFVLAFVTKQREVDAFGKAIAKKATRDAVVWFAYPKGASKSIKARSVAITDGKLSASSDLKESGASPSIRIGRHYAFDVWNLSRR